MENELVYFKESTCSSIFRNKISLHCFSQTSVQITHCIFLWLSKIHWWFYCLFPLEIFKWSFFSLICFSLMSMLLINNNSIKKILLIVPCRLSRCYGITDAISQAKKRYLVEGNSLINISHNIYEESQYGAKGIVQCLTFWLTCTRHRVWSVAQQKINMIL